MHYSKHHRKLNAEGRKILVPYLTWKAEKLEDLAMKHKIETAGGKFVKCGKPGCEVCPLALERRSPLIESEG